MCAGVTHHHEALVVDLLQVQLHLTISIIRHHAVIELAQSHCGTHTCRYTHSFRRQVDETATRIVSDEPSTAP
jgi:hypothetical protein